MNKTTEYFFFVRHHVYHQKEFSKYSRAHSTFLVYSRFKRINHKFLQIHMCNIKIQQKAYQFKNLARFNDGQKIITKEGQTAIQTFCQAQPLLTALMHFCQKAIIQLHYTSKDTFFQLHRRDIFICTKRKIILLK